MYINKLWCFFKVLLHFKIKRDKTLDSGQHFSVLVVFPSVVALNETHSEGEIRCRHTFCLIHCASQLGVWDRQLCWSGGAGCSGSGPTLYRFWASIGRGSRKEGFFPQDLCGTHKTMPLHWFILCLWSQISPDMRDIFWSSLFPPPYGVFLKETVDTVQFPPVEFVPHLQ